MSKPEIHFAHANGLPSACYARLFSELTPVYDVTAVPILGTDPRYPVDDNWHNLVGQVVDSIRERCTGPVIGLGHSLGGILTFMAAHRNPELFRAVVVMDAAGANGLKALIFGIMKTLGLSDRVTPAGRSAGRREVWPSRDLAREQLGAKKLYRSFDPECFEDFLRFGLTDCDQGVRLTIPTEVELAIFRASPHDSWRYRWPLKVPGAVLTGTRSEYAGQGYNERLARHHRLIHRKVEGGHMFPMENPRLTAEQIIAVLHELPGTGL